VGSAPSDSPVRLVPHLGIASRRLKDAPDATGAAERLKPGYRAAGKDRPAALRLGVAPRPVPGRRPEASPGTALRRP
jgi:hypothetical protein